MPKSNPKKPTHHDLFNPDLKLFKPYCDDGDALIPRDMHIYYTTPDNTKTKQKTGSTDNPSRRQKQLKLQGHEFHLIMTVPKMTATLNDVREMEKLNARMIDLPVEHNGHRQAVLRVRTGPMGQSGNYVVTNLETGVSTTVSEAGQFEQKHGLSQSLLSKCANPKWSHKYVPINGVKHTVSYADPQKGGE